MMRYVRKMVEGFINKCYSVAPVCYVENDCYMAQVVTMYAWKCGRKDNLYFSFLDNWTFNYDESKEELLEKPYIGSQEKKCLEKYYNIKIQEIAVPNRKDIIEVLDNSLSESPVLLPVDSSIVPWIVSGNKGSYLHVLIITGIIHDKKRVVVTDAFSNREGELISFDDIVKGYVTGIEKIDFSNMIQPIIDTNTVLRIIADCARNNNVIKKLYIFAEDVDKDKLILEEYNAFVNSEFNVSILDNVFNRKKINALLEKNREQDNNIIEEIISEFHKDTKCWENLHTTFVIVSIKKSINNSNERLAKIIRDIAQREERIYQIIDNYTKYVETK